MSKKKIIKKKTKKKTTTRLKNIVKSKKTSSTKKTVKLQSTYDQSKVLAIVYNVWISGTKLNLAKKECISSIDIKETVEGSDVATIILYDPQFLFIEDNIFLEENTIKIELGWDISTYRVTFNGYISAIDINFTNAGIPMITVTCMDNTHRMNRKRKNKTYKNTTSAKVVKKIVKSYGYTCVIEKNYKFTKKDTITQSNQSDIDFITSLAQNEVYPFTARLVGKKFYYVKMGKLTTPKITLTYRKYPHEIISFNPRINKEYKQTEVSSSKVTNKNKNVSTTKKTTNTKTGNITKGNTKADTSKTYTSDGGSGNSNTSGSSSSTKTKTYDPKTRTWS